MKRLGVCIRLDVSNILFGVDGEVCIVTKSQLNYVNHIILIGKMSISIFKKRNAHMPLIDVFENSVVLRLKNTY